MKNIHVLPTEKYSDLVYSTSKYGGLFLSRHYSPMKEMGDSYQHLYITDYSEIKEGDWCLDLDTCKVFKLGNWHTNRANKIILTTDQDLIADGVEAIDDDFLEWFVKNPSCEFVQSSDSSKDGFYNSLFIPKEEPNPFELPKALPDDVFYQSLEPKQETLEEAADRYENSFNESDGTESVDFIEGANYQAKKSYSEEEVRDLILRFNDDKPGTFDASQWFDQNKKSL
jgi:hypothetical protein